MRSPGASTRTSPGAYRAPDTSAGKALMQAEINTLTSTRVPSYLTELMTLGRTLKRRAGDILAYITPPPHHRRPHPSHQRPPRTPTRLRPRIPKPHQLHHPSTPRNRRIQTPTTPSIMKSPYCLRCLRLVIRLVRPFPALVRWRNPLVGHRGFLLIVTTRSQALSIVDRGSCSLMSGCWVSEVGARV